MTSSLKDKLIAVLQNAGNYSRSLLVAPTAILWPDKERQWEKIIAQLNDALPQLLTFGTYDPSMLIGPAIWIKCMISGTVQAGKFSHSLPAIIYLPGVSKEELKSPETAGLMLQPIISYAYAGTITTQYNGREWTVPSLMENKEDGLGLTLAKDRATKEALLKALPAIFDEHFEWPSSAIDAGYLHSLLFPNAIPSILEWICKGDDFFQALSAGMNESFTALCEARFSFKPDYKNINNIVLKLGSQQGAWKEVWQHYAAAPSKYPELIDLLRSAKPDDLGSGLYTIPEESWPQVAEGGEELRVKLQKRAIANVTEVLAKLKDLGLLYGRRSGWVWGELGYMPLEKALPHLLRMCEACFVSIPTGSVAILKQYYLAHGVIADEAMRNAFSCAKKDVDKEALTGIISLVYKPWLESLAIKFQELLADGTEALPTTSVIDDTDEVILFVDAFRYELAVAFKAMLEKSKHKVLLNATWSALPSLTPTAKPAVSPVMTEVSINSIPNDFRPQLNSGKDLNTINFRSVLEARGYSSCGNATDINSGQKCWIEIGDIDMKGHAEGAGLTRRIPELFAQVTEALDVIFSKGVKRVKIVTDHGWLLLPGGLPKTSLSKELTDTRWGRCATIKDGATTDLLHLPWYWNKAVYIAYAPGISFFKAGEAYAHGGISLQECLTPVMIVEPPIKARSARIKGDPQWKRMLCIVETEGAPDGYQIDIRRKLDDPKSTILATGVKFIKDNKATLQVDADYALTSAIVVLMDTSDRILNSKPTMSGA